MPGDGTNLDHRVQRAKDALSKYHNAPSTVSRALVLELATAVVEMAEELSKARNIYVDELWGRIQELEAQLAESHESIQTISATRDKESVVKMKELMLQSIRITRLEAQLATARKLIVWAQEIIHLPDADEASSFNERADQLLKETEHA